MAREPRIDIVRGFAILTILINHLTQVVEDDGLSGWMIATPTRYGYSTAAELFVAMSGYMVGLVYLSRPAPIRAILKRAGTLWVYNAVLLVLVVPLIAIMTPRELAFWRLADFLTKPFREVTGFLLLGDAPRLLDILQLYIKLMLVAPVAIWIHRVAPKWLIPLSLLVFVVAQALIIARISGKPDAGRGPWLDLLSWQMMFFVPMALGARRVHVRLFAWLEGNWAALAVLVALYAAGAVAKVMAVPEPLWFTGPYGLTLLRVAHSLLVLLLYASALTLALRWLEREPFRAIGAVGRHSLDCFAAGVLFTYALGTLWEWVGGGHLAYYLCAATGIGLTVALAEFREWRRLGVE